MNNVTLTTKEYSNNLILGLKINQITNIGLFIPVKVSLSLNILN